MTLVPLTQAGAPWPVAAEPSGASLTNSAAKSSIVAFKRGLAPMSPAEVQAAKQTLEKLLNGSTEPAQARKLLDWVKTPSGQAVFKQVVGAVKWGSLIALPLSLGGSADRNLQQRSYVEQQAGQGNLRTLFDFMIERADPKALVSFSRGDDKQRIALENLREIVFELLGDGHLAQATQLLEPLAAQMQSDGLLGPQLSAGEWAEHMTRRFVPAPVPAPVEPAQKPGTPAQAPTRALPDTLAQRSGTVVSQLGAAIRDFNAEPAAPQRDALQRQLDGATRLYQQSGERWGAQARSGYIAYRDQAERALGRPTTEDRALQAVATLAQSIREHNAEPTAQQRESLNEALAQTASLHRRSASQWPQAALDNFVSLRPQAQRALSQPVLPQAQPAHGGASTPTPPPGGDELKPLPKEVEDARKGEEILKTDSDNRVRRAVKAAHNATTAKELKAALDELAEIAPELLLDMLDDRDFQLAIESRIDNMPLEQREAAMQVLRNAEAIVQANLRASTTVHVETTTTAAAEPAAARSIVELPTAAQMPPLSSDESLLLRARATSSENRELIETLIGPRADLPNTPPVGPVGRWALEATKNIKTDAQAQQTARRETAAYYRSGMNPAFANRNAFLDDPLAQTRDPAAEKPALIALEIPAAMKPVNDQVGHMAADRLLKAVLNVGSTVAAEPQYSGVTLYHLGAMRFAFEGPPAQVRGFVDELATRLEQFPWGYTATGMRYQAAGLPVVTADLSASAASSRKDLLFAAIDRLDAEAAKLKGTVLPEERGAPLLTMPPSLAPPGEPDGLWTVDRRSGAAEPESAASEPAPTRRANEQFSAPLREAIHDLTKDIRNDEKGIAHIQGTVHKSFTTDESMGGYVGNQLAFDRIENERMADQNIALAQGRHATPLYHGFVDVGAVGTTNQKISRFAGDVVLSAVHKTAAEVAQEINLEKGLRGDHAIEVFAVGGDEIRWIASSKENVDLFGERFSAAMQNASIEGRTAGELSNVQGSQAAEVGTTAASTSQNPPEGFAPLLHQNAVAIANDLNIEYGLRGDDAVKVLPLNDGKVRYTVPAGLADAIRLPSEFSRRYEAATRETMATGQPVARRKELREAEIKNIPVYVGTGATKEQAEARSNDSKNNDLNRQAGQLPPGYKVRTAPSEP